MTTDLPIQLADELVEGDHSMRRNQRLLISVFDAQEAREAILGGARVIDCEDPAGALGDISPRKVTMIADAVIGYKRDLEVQISTNIGENQLLFKRDDKGHAVQRFDNEIAGKASQASLGVAAAMGTDIHPVNIVKVGLDGMPRRIALETLQEVVLTMHNNPYFARSEVVGVFFAQDLKVWNERKTNKFVIRDLLLLREYVVDADGDVDIDALFGNDPKTMAAIKDKIGSDADLFDANGKIKSKVRLTELYNLVDLGYAEVPGEDPRMSYIYSAADLAAEAGADGIMIDTRIHTKVAYMCCLNYGTQTDVNGESGLPRHGIYSLDELATYARYCHQKNIQFWASGSIQPYQVQAVWGLNDGDIRGVVDAMAVRSGASGPPRVVTRPGSAGALIDNRASRRIYRDLVQKYAPPSE
jgi:uncharacterized protein (UPF0264 family)